jgi:diketogulonate reductase-like aldo/keto reductase
MTTSFKLNDGYAIPWIALGTGTALYGKDATNAVAQAIAGGFTHLDGAQAYANEESLGAAIQQAGVPRAQLFVTTKLGKLPAGTSVVESLKESLRKLQLDHVDLFLIHSSAQHQDLPATWKGMEECKAAGLAKRSVGARCWIRWARGSSRPASASRTSARSTSRRS